AERPPFTRAFFVRRAARLEDRGSRRSGGPAAGLKERLPASGYGLPEKTNRSLPVARSLAPVAVFKLSAADPERRVGRRRVGCRPSRSRRSQIQEKRPATRQTYSAPTRRESIPR